MTLATHGPADLGRTFFQAEFAVAVAGWALEINPFDQPTSRRPRTTPSEVLDSGSVPQTSARGRRQLRPCSATPGRPTTLRSWATCRLGRDRWASPTCARRSARPPAPRRLSDTGLDACIRPVSFTRAAPDRALSAAGKRPRAGCRDPRRELLVRDAVAAQAAGDLQTLPLARPRGRASQLVGTPPTAVRALSERIARLLRGG